MKALSRNLILSALTGAMALATILTPAVASADTWIVKWTRVPRQTVSYVHGRRVVRTTYHMVRHPIRIPSSETGRVRRHNHNRYNGHDNGHHYGQLKHHRGHNDND